MSNEKTKNIEVVKNAKKEVVKNAKNEVVKNAKNEGVKILKSEDYTSLFCKSLKNAIDSNRGILASVFLSMNAGVTYEDLLTFAKSSCGVEWNDSNRAFYSQPIRAGKNLFNKMKKDSSFLKIANDEELTLDEKNKSLVNLIKLKKLSVNSLLRGKESSQNNDGDTDFNKFNNSLIKLLEKYEEKLTLEQMIKILKDNLTHYTNKLEKEKEKKKEQKAG